MELKIRNEAYRIEADMMSYELVWDFAPEYNLPANGIVGYFKNNSNPEIEVNIMVNEPFMMQEHRTSAYFFMDNGNYCQGCIIFLTLDYYYKVRREVGFEASLWHEIGHFHTLQYFECTSDITSNRHKANALGKVMAEEVAADLFCALYVTYDGYIEMINTLIRRRRYMEGIDDFRREAIAEMTRRKKTIKSLLDEGSCQNIKTIIERFCSEEQYMY